VEGSVWMIVQKEGLGIGVSHDQKLLNGRSMMRGGWTLMGNHLLWMILGVW
jgi:hypothetical protein